MVSIGSVKKTDKLDALVKQILAGNTGLLIDGLEEALVIDVKGGG